MTDSIRPGVRPRSRPSRPARTRCGCWTSPSSRPPPAGLGGWPAAGTTGQSTSTASMSPRPPTSTTRSPRSSWRWPTIRPLRPPSARRRPGRRPDRPDHPRGHDRDRQRRPVPLLPLRGVQHRPPRARTRPHPGAHAGTERLTRTGLRHAEVRTAVPRRDHRTRSCSPSEPRTTASSTTPSDRTRRSPGTGRSRCTWAWPTRPSPPFKPKKPCQLLDAGHGACARCCRRWAVTCSWVIHSSSAGE